ncbi:flagellar basal body rod protein FlgG [Geobacillus thermodenitrificans]|jgi:flagellar hook protein FlgE|uniref:Flagellar basal body rod protein FlgG n=1 Tax=Geobacillus thermodenitrificans TaxID=33940 RepID=A0ABY9QHC8_GEOTD|nr:MULTISPECIES: flagellar basal body rod protein FlgG [Geobacillus]ARP42214.1 Flagellar basal-body rod protein FlgG [Geobacillus thermodenitrificans]ATO36445.1 flagellar basal-body rod protein FlgF [Geobacillus thermodenitrificans]OQP11225.1 flagellar basal-body rod protein FlgF [Geobacillus sp. 47C-IIb]QNU30872.1 flagellar basal body rod protein FlgG [Geobacillus sp. 47C-IIb]WMV77412.1 flagellar basal body rod protein FlgG [Geobacillus thermodenitrificans]
MLRSMYSGIGAMRNFQTKLDVIGNNIANVNTYGFKKGRTIFQDLMSQTISGASGPSAASGGTNPRQVGLGSQLAAIDTIHTQGSLQTTGRVLDLAISGDGFFIVGDANGNNQMYTRAGNFYLDSEGYIVNANGLYLLGDGGPLKIDSNAKSLSIGADGNVTIVDDTGNLQLVGTIQLAKFANPDGLEKEGNNLFRETVNSGDPQIGVPGANGTGKLVSDALEMSNVDLAEEFTEMIVAQRGFQANTRIITTSDEILQELVNLKK